MKKYYELGIGGISMSALAIMLKEKGFEVSGSDDAESRATHMLIENGISVDVSINKEKIANADVIVFSSAIKFDNPQFVYAKKLGKKMMTRGEILGEISRNYEKVIAIAGSHGKTTTTAMLYEILNCAGKNPTLHLGGFRIEDKKNYALGDDEFFITEACEYCDNFLNLHPYIAVVTNVEKEHMDYFKNFENQLCSFEKFKRNSKYVIDSLSGLEARNVRHDKNGFLSFSIFENGQKVLRLHMHICEDVNTQNCLYAYKVAKILNIPNEIIKLGLERFQGVCTRFERMESKYFENIVCDYAHHPTEIAKTINSAKKIYKGKRLVVIFQPHTYSRTKALLPEFLKVFEKEECPIFF